jgi:protein TonB
MSRFSSTYLDILFRDRNTQYGAYVLRKAYPFRLVLSVIIVGLLVFLFSLSYWVWRNRTPTVSKPIPQLQLTKLDPIPDALELPPLPASPKKSIQPTQATSSAAPSYPKPSVASAPVPSNDPVPETEPFEPLATSSVKLTENQEQGEGSVNTTIGESNGEVNGEASGKIPEDANTDVGGTMQYEDVDTKPKYKGGNFKLFWQLRRYFFQHYDQPRTRNNGNIYLHIVINKAGYISQIMIDSTQASPAIINAVQQAFHKLDRFKPGTKNGEAVDTKVKVALKYRL